MPTTTSVDPLNLACAAVVHLGKSDDPFTDHLVKAMREASEDQLDVLDKAYTELVYAERTRRQDPKRLRAVAWVQPRNQCMDCGWPMHDGYTNGSSEGDVEPYGFCRNPKCSNQY